MTRLKSSLPLVLALLVCTLFSLLPHLAQYLESGDPAYFADSDDTQLYLTYAAYAYHNDVWKLRDPITANGPTFTPAIQLLPGAIVAKALGLGPGWIPVLWRLWAGVSVTLTLFFLLRFLVRDDWLAAFATMLALTDAGFLSANLLLRQFTTAFAVASGTAANLFATFPQVHVQWRIITPGLSIAFLFLHIWLVGRARETSVARGADLRPQPAALAACVLSLVALFPLYFYFWTAALLAAGLAFLFDHRHRALHLATGVGGLLLGAPALLAGRALKEMSHPDVLPRNNFFLPIPRFAELLWPKAALLVFVVLCALALWKKRERFYYPALVALAAALLLNHQLVTKLQIQNFHYMYVLGPVAYLAFVGLGLALLAERMPRARLVALLAGVTALSVLTGFYTRYAEAFETRESAALRDSYQDYRDELKPYALPWAPNSIVAGEPALGSLLLIFHGLRPLAGMMLGLSPTLPDAEWNRRLVLNEILRGRTRADFSADQERESLNYPWGKWAHDAGLQESLFTERLRLFDEISRDPLPLIQQYGIRYVAIRANAPNPHSVLSDPRMFREVVRSRAWIVWEKLENIVAE